MPKDSRPRMDRFNQIESLEERVVMSADPLGGLLGGAVSPHAINEQPAQIGVQPHGFNAAAPGLLTGTDFNTPAAGQAPDFWLSPETETTLTEQLDGLTETFSSAHDSTGLTAARERFGFRGLGQTVAVIDSGIAYDHFALGGGLGDGFRVVGGYDFTEGDADPYDDDAPGTASHGTHVAGIVGADGEESGVAPEVDLVGLRVFDDNGNGFFNWVEQALQWVYDNRFTFENPITTVNLSLGTNFNSDTAPAWANLEEEFQQLEEAGIFIAVSAGNSFQSFNTPGLSYPAASEFVVPVLSTDADGSLSFFSQRHQRGIAAPGRFIRSTVPDHAGNNNGLGDDYAFKSGTSMAAPYVAGASVLIREAMQFAGYTNINQDTIYDHIVATADQFEDPATGLTFNRLNLGRALDALLPEDDFGSSIETAFNLGTLGASVSTAAAAPATSGAIGEASDADFFTFTAGVTGNVTFTAENTTHYLDANWQGFGGEGWRDGDSYTLEVVAGQEYTIALTTDNGVGRYDLAIAVEETFSFVDWGLVAGQATQTGVTFGSETWFRVEASATGFLTADLLNATGETGFDLYDASLNLVSNSANGRVDVYAAAGDEFFLRVEGDGLADFRLTNLVSLDGATVNVDGTTGDDTLNFTAGESAHSISVNGVTYSFDATTHTTFNLDGGAGSDTVTLTGTADDETATIALGQAELTGEGFMVAATAAETVRINSGGGFDEATLVDSAGDDSLLARSDYTRLSGDGFNHFVFGFQSVNAVSQNGGFDQATLQDSAGDDRLYAEASYAELSGDGFSNRATGFDRVFTFSNNGGYDIATLADAAGDDLFYAESDYAYLSGDGFLNYVARFDEVHATADNGGDDVARLFDSAGDDTLYAEPEYATLSGTGFLNRAAGFGIVYANAINGGNDTATLVDSAGNDRLRAEPEFASLTSQQGQINFAGGFDSVTVQATRGGSDVATLFGSAGDDVFVSFADSSSLTGDGYNNTVEGFDIVYAFDHQGGEDTATIYDTPANDRFSANEHFAYIISPGDLRYVSGFADVTTTSVNGGFDQATFIDTAGDDQFYGRPTDAYLQSDRFIHRAEGFDIFYAFSNNGGNDTAFLEDSAGDDEFIGHSTHSYLRGDGYLNYVGRFDRVEARSVNGGNDTANLHDSAGVDFFFSSPTHASLSGDGHHNEVSGFARVDATSTHGGADEASFIGGTGGDTAIGRDDYFAHTSAAGTRQASGFSRVELEVDNTATFDDDVESIDYAYELLGTV